MSIARRSGIYSDSNRSPRHAATGCTDARLELSSRMPRALAVGVAAASLPLAPRPLRRGAVVLCAAAGSSCSAGSLATRSRAPPERAASATRCSSAADGHRGFGSTTIAATCRSRRWRRCCATRSSPSRTIASTATSASTRSRSRRAVCRNVRAGRMVEGGSTLTQQLARSLFLSNRRTVGRKAKEAVLALMLESNSARTRSSSCT